MRHSDIPYTVFVIADPFEVFEKDYPHLVGVDAKANSINKLDFMAREKDEMAILTKASEVAENVWVCYS
jgi:dual specificity MAP kinase phosphatase